jgi:hypothetical protein
MQRTDFDFDVISGPSGPPLSFRSPAAALAAPRPPALSASLDQPAPRPESPAPQGLPR